MIEVVLSFALAIAAGLVLGTIVLLLPEAGFGRASPGEIAGRLCRTGRAGSMARGRLKLRSALGPTLLLMLATVLVAATVLGVLTAMIRTNAGMAIVDGEISAWAAALATAASLKVFGYLTQAGSIIVVTAAALAAIVCALRRPGRWRTVLFIVLVVGGQFLLANVLKTAVGRARPDLSPFRIFSGYAFPSGHTTAAAAVWPAVAFVFGRGRSRRARAILAGVAVGLAVAVACSRVFLGAHWTSDVLGGLVLGWMWFGLCALALRGDVPSAAPRTKQASAASSEPERPR
jgi:membrane-associated phospholipid phosphatase